MRWRTLPPATLLALALLVQALVPAEASDPRMHDDAGSGRDAPGRHADALPLEAGTYEGALFSAGVPGAGAPLGDREDWYAFEVASGRRASVTAELLPASGPIAAVRFELRRPDGALAAWTVAEPGAPPRDAFAITAETGAWRVRALALGSGAAAYRFAFADAPEAGFHHVRAGPGWLALGVEVRANGSFSARLQTTYGSDGAATRDDVLVLQAPGTLLLHRTTAAGLADGATAASDAAGVRVHGWARTGDAFAASAAPQVTLTRPGTYHVVLLTHAPEAYAFVHDVALRNATLLGATSGGALHALRAEDFRAAAAVATARADAALAATATVHVSHRLVGTFACGMPETSSCSVTRPDGATQPAPYASFAGAAPGAWTFAREASAGPRDDAYPLFAADVVLPGV